MQQAYEDIIYTKDNGAATVSINRPWTLNAFRPRTIDEMLDAFQDAWYDDAIGVVVLTGEQGNFCSGGDQKIRGEGGYNDESGTPRLQVRNLHRTIREIPKPVIILLHASTRDLQSLREISEPVTDLDTEEEVMGVDLPILPSKVTFHDAEIDLQVDRLLRDNVDLTDLEASFHFQEGQLARSPFSFAYDTQRFHGEIDLDLRGEIPRFRLEFRGDGGNLGQVLRKEGLIEDSGLVAERIDLRIDASGSSLRTIIGSADLSGRLDNVRWQIQPAGLEEPLEIQLTELNLSGPKGEPIEIDGKGTLEGEPLDLGLVLRMSKEIQDQPTQTVPFHLTAGLAGTTIEMLGEFELPVTKGDFETQTTVQGESLSTLSTLMGNDLPDLGPYRLNTRLVIGDDGLMLRNIDFLLGESDLSGEIRYAKSNGRPTFKADLTSQLIRTEDLFDFDPQAAIEEEASGRREGPSLPENIGRFLRQIEEFDAELDLTSREFRTAGGPFREMDITADLQLGESSGRFSLLMEARGTGASTWSSEPGAATRRSLPARLPVTSISPTTPSMPVPPFSISGVAACSNRCCPSSSLARSPGSTVRWQSFRWPRGS